MRKFQYVVTIGLDDDYLKDMVKEDPSLLESGGFVDIPEEEFISVFAKKMTDPIAQALYEGLGDAGESTVEASFLRECK